MQFPKSSRPCMTAEALGALNLSALTLAALIVAAFVAGWVDAVVGGGGLIQLPALLIGLPSDTAPAVILGTNKISSFCGTATSSLTYALRIPLDWLTVLPLVIASAIGSAVGALLAKLLAQGGLHPDRAGGADWRGSLHLASAAAGHGLDTKARRAPALWLDGCDRPRRRRVRRVSWAWYRFLLRDLACRRARLRISGGERHSQDRQLGDQLVRNRGLRA